MTPLQRLVMDVLIDRQWRGKSITVTGVANETGIKDTTVERIFRTLRAKGEIERHGDEHRIVRVEPVLPTYRRVAEDGVEVTQCPTMKARGYGLRLVDGDA